MAGVLPWLDDLDLPGLGESSAAGAAWLDDLADGLGLHVGSEPVEAQRAEGQAAHWRCLDSSHAADCTLCTPPPEAGHERLFALPTRSADGPSALAMLRSQLSRTAEWNGEERSTLVRVPRSRPPVHARALTGGLGAGVSALYANACACVCTGCCLR